MYPREFWLFFLHWIQELNITCLHNHYKWKQIIQWKQNKCQNVISKELRSLYYHDEKVEPVGINPELKTWRAIYHYYSNSAGCLEWPSEAARRCRPWNLQPITWRVGTCIRPLTSRGGNLHMSFMKGNLKPTKDGLLTQHYADQHEQNNITYHSPTAPQFICMSLNGLLFVPSWPCCLSYVLLFCWHLDKWLWIFRWVQMHIGLWCGF